MESPAVPDLLFTTLLTSPTIKTAYTFTTLHDPSPAVPAQSQAPRIWLIFVNGLGLPQAFWQPTLSHLKSLIPPTFPTQTYTTTYDRQYQGLSQPITAPLGPPAPAPIHSFQSTISELSALLSHLTTQNPILSNATKILVAHSIGVPLARLFIQSQHQHQHQHHPISALIALDSNLANTDLPALLPDPTSKIYSPSLLPADTTFDQLLSSRTNYIKLFAPTAPNAEGLDRSELPELLPYSNRPLLTTEPDTYFILRVLAHDPETFEVEGTKICTAGLTRMYIQPAWDAYNRGLLELDGVGKGEVVIAKGAGHFLQRDRPDVVAGEVWGVAREVVGL